MNDHRAYRSLQILKKVLMLSIVNYNQPNRNFVHFICVKRVLYQLNKAELILVSNKQDTKSALGANIDGWKCPLVLKNLQSA